MSRPYVSQAQRIAKERIERLILHTAQVNRIDLKHIDATYGYAVGHCPAFDSRVYITYSVAMGVQTWYSHVGDCSGCKRREECEQLLQSLSDEWKIPLVAGVPPTEAGAKLFDTITRELNWID